MQSRFSVHGALPFESLFLAISCKQNLQEIANKWLWGSFSRFQIYAIMDKDSNDNNFPQKNKK